MMRDDRGQSVVELLGMTPLLALAGLALAQALLLGHTAVVTEQAARTAARVAMVTDDAGATEAAATSALPSWLRGRSTVTFPGGGTHRVQVSSPIPTLLPGVTFSGVRIDRVVEMPEVGSRWD